MRRLLAAMATERRDLEATRAANGATQSNCSKARKPPALERCRSPALLGNCGEGGVRE